MFIELHLIQNFAPSNLNRDDTGAPKDCEFGGFRRARISSQCLKRAIRTEFRDEALIPAAHLAVRTKLVVDEVAGRLVRHGRDAAVAAVVVESVLAGASLKVEEGKTQYLLFLGEREIDALATLCLEHWETLAALAPAPAPGAQDEADEADGETGRAGGQRSRRQAKQVAKNAIPKPVQDATERLLDGGKAADLALFGRMIADLPERNIDAASQVAHAISTNAVEIEFDFYTAVDDLQPEDTSGAGMLGTVEFNSACFYRYANIDLAQLQHNLGGDAELARQTVRAFLQASIAAIPTGKQNSMAAQNPPSLIFAVVRERGLWSLANAFVTPVRPARDHGLIARSVRALDDYWGTLLRVYGDDGISATAVVNLEQEQLTALAGAEVPSAMALVDRITGALPVAAPGVSS